MRIAVVGCGVFGLGCAIALRERGHEVTVFERGPIPHPRAASTDVSRTIQRLYGDRHDYIALVQAAEPVWRRWQAESRVNFYLPIGHVFLASGQDRGTRAGDSMRSLGLAPIPVAEARARFPQFAIPEDATVFFDDWGGYLVSADAVSAMANLAEGLGVIFREDGGVGTIDERTSGVDLGVGDRTLRFDLAVVATGAWLPTLLPVFRDSIAVTRQCVAFFDPVPGSEHLPGALPVFAIDSGPDRWYGHPLRDGRIKIADNDLGAIVDPDDAPEVPTAFADSARAFVGRWMPGLAEGRYAGSRACLYANTPDNDFIVDLAPGHRRVFVAGGGGGHGFKFGAIVGEIAADRIEGRDHPLGERFRLGARLSPP